MKKLASTLPNMILSLGGICVISGFLLGYADKITADPIARQAEESRVAAIAEVAPQFDNNIDADACEFEINGRTFTVYPAYMNGKLEGAAIKGGSSDGFSGDIEIMCGFNADGTIRDYRVLSQAETPGLGARMEQWFRDPAANRSVLGKNPGDKSFRVSKDGGAIDGITAATISSRAFLSTFKNAFEAYRQYQEK